MNEFWRNLLSECVLIQVSVYVQNECIYASDISYIEINKKA